MNRSIFLIHLETKGCIVIRHDTTGYSVVRNIKNGLMSGVLVNDPLRAASVCRICKTLGLTDGDLPAEAQPAKEIIELAHKNHGKEELK